jgi:hypothetical protein
MAKGDEGMVDDLLAGAQAWGFAQGVGKVLRVTRVACWS